MRKKIKPLPEIFRFFKIEISWIFSRILHVFQNSVIFFDFLLTSMSLSSKKYFCKIRIYFFRFLFADELWIAVVPPNLYQDNFQNDHRTEWATAWPHREDNVRAFWSCNQWVSPLLFTSWLNTPEPFEPTIAPVTLGILSHLAVDDNFAYCLFRRVVHQRNRRSHKSKIFRFVFL